jgi:hypothetical protein
MGEYKALFSLPKHPFGTVQNLDDNDPVVMQRVKSGMLIPVLKPGPTTTVWADKADEVAEVAEVPEAEAEAKPETKKRVSRKKVEPEPEPEPEAEVAETETLTVEAPSSVMTSWNLSD